MGDREISLIAFADAVTFLVENGFVVEGEKPLEIEVDEDEDAELVTAKLKTYTIAP